MSKSTYQFHAFMNKINSGMSQKVTSLDLKTASREYLSCFIYFQCVSKGKKYKGESIIIRIKREFGNLFNI